MPAPRNSVRHVAHIVSTFRVRAKTIAGQEAYFEQNVPHPNPLPSDGRGNRPIRLWHLLQPSKRPTDGGRFSLSHPMGEGRGGVITSQNPKLFLHDSLVERCSRRWGARSSRQLLSASRRYLFSVVDAQAAGARRLRRFRVAQTRDVTKKATS